MTFRRAGEGRVNGASLGQLPTVWMEWEPVPLSGNQRKILAGRSTSVPQKESLPTVCTCGSPFLSLHTTSFFVLCVLKSTSCGLFDAYVSLFGEGGGGVFCSWCFVASCNALWGSIIDAVPFYAQTYSFSCE